MILRMLDWIWDFSKEYAFPILLIIIIFLIVGGTLASLSLHNDSSHTYTIVTPTQAYHGCREVVKTHPITVWNGKTNTIIIVEHDRYWESENGQNIRFIKEPK
jgi:hypothetical protein